MHNLADFCGKMRNLAEFSGILRNFAEICGHLRKNAELENVTILQRNNYAMASRAELDIPPTPSDPGGEPAVIPYSPLPSFSEAAQKQPNRVSKAFETQNQGTDQENQGKPTVQIRRSGVICTLGFP